MLERVRARDTCVVTMVVAVAKLIIMLKRVRGLINDIDTNRLILSLVAF